MSQVEATFKGLVELCLEMGWVIRNLDEDCENLEFWTNDGEYICCDGRWDAATEVLASLDLFVCTLCGKVHDIEDSFRVGDHLLCVNCNRKEE